MVPALDILPAPGKAPAPDKIPVPDISPPGRLLPDNPPQGRTPPETMSPDADFVVKNDPDMEGGTRMITDSDMRKIKRRTNGREDLKHRDPQGIDIALLIAVAAPGLFRGGIVDGSHHIGSDGVRYRAVWRAL